MSDARRWLGALYERLGIYLTACVLVGAGILVSDEFLTPKNLVSVLNAVALLGIVATGMAFVTYSGHMADLSVPAIMAFAGITAVASLSLGLAPALLAGLAAGMLIGAMNGWVVGHFNANPILWTLAVSFFMEGFMRFTWSNNQVYPDTETGSPGAAFIDLFRMSLGPVPLIVVVMGAMFLAGHLVMTGTRLGVETQRVGASKAAAVTSGIHVKRVVFLDFVLASFAASVAGIFLASMNKLGVFYLGKGYDFRSVTAVVIGGMALSGGTGSMSGVLGGVLVIGLLVNIMTFLGMTSFQQDMATGALFILVVGIQRFQSGRER